MNEKVEEKNKKINIIDILALNNNIIIDSLENGEIYIFEIDNKNLNGKFILSQKAHENTLISLDKIKDKKNKFVACDETKIKRRVLKKSNNIYIMNWKITLNDYSKSDYVYLYILNDSNCIPFINE